DPLDHLLPGDAHVFQAEGHLFVDGPLGSRHLRKGILKDDSHLGGKPAHAAFQDFQARDGHSAPIGAAVKMGNQADQGLAKGGLSLSLPSDDVDHLPFVHFEGQIVQGQRFRLRIAVFQMFHDHLLHPKILQTTERASTRSRHAPMARLWGYFLFSLSHVLFPSKWIPLTSRANALSLAWISELITTGPIRGRNAFTLTHRFPSVSSPLERWASMMVRVVLIIC